MLKSLIFNVFKLVSGLFNGFPETQAVPVRVNRKSGKRFFTVAFMLFSLAMMAQVPDGIYPNTTDAAGKKQGAWKKLDENGLPLYVGQFKDDKPYGMFTYFDGEGKKMTEMNFYKDGAIAYAKMYHVNGKLQAEGKYVGQKKDSVWNFYNTEGVFLSTETFLNGKKEGKSIVPCRGTTFSSAPTGHGGFISFIATNL